MKLPLLFALASAGVLIAAMPSPAAAQWPDGRLSCESADGRYRECPVDTRAGVQMVRQLSRSPCIEGQTWGLRRDAVWVDRGCRAEFAVGYGYGNSNSSYGGGNTGWGYGNRYRDARRYGYQDNTRVLCESPRGRHNRCPIDTRYGVVVVRQLSETRCREGHNWGYENGEVWVDHGCRAEFAVGGNRGYTQPGYYPQPVYGYGQDAYGGGYGDGQVFTCASNDGRQNYCRAYVSRGVELLRQTSRSPCVQGQTWGWDRGGVWVNQGCRGEFRAW